MMRNKMETLPSLHLFSEATLPKAPYSDLAYLKATIEMQPNLIAPHCGTRVCTEGKAYEKHHEVFQHLDGFCNYLAKLDPDKKSGVILCNSPTGKTESLNQIAELAKMLSQPEKRVIMLDCSFETRSQGFFDLPSGVGLGDYVAGNAGLDMIINESRHENVYFIKNGYSLGNSVKSLMSTRFNELIENVKNRFDYVLVNSPPYRECIDAFVLAKFLRPIVLLLPGHEPNHRDDLRDVRDELGVLKLPIMELAEA